jgi:hypothetical protein
MAAKYIKKNKPNETKLIIKNLITKIENFLQ